jgi:hypothetical protein
MQEEVQKESWEICKVGPFSLSYSIELNVLLENVSNKEDGRIITENKGTGITLDLRNCW